MGRDRHPERDQQPPLIGGALGNVSSLGENLAEVAWWAVALMVFSHTSTHIVRSVAWARLAQAALPDVKVSNFGMVLAMGAGTAVNSIVPARMGEPVKIWAAEKAAPGAAKATLVGALLTITAADGLISLGVVGVGAFLGPGGAIVERADVLTGAYGIIALAVIVALVGVAIWLARTRRGWFTKMKSQLMDGLEPLESTTWYLTHVLSLQIVGWGFRAVTSLSH